MKKYSEMNGHEKIAAKNIKGAFDYCVGGWYNSMLDGYEEDIPTLDEAKEEVYYSAMNDDYRTVGIAHFGGAPKEMRFAGEDFCRKYIEKLFAEDDDAATLWGEDEAVEQKDKEDENMAKNNAREEARAYILKNYTAKEMREHLKAEGVKGVSRAKKEELVEMMLDMEEQKDANRGNTVTISKVKMFAFTGMFLGEFEAEVQDGKILVNTTSKGELMFDLETGKEITDANKARYANRVEAV